LAQASLVEAISCAIDALICIRQDPLA